MSIKLQILLKEGIKNRNDYKKAEDIANDIKGFMGTTSIQTKLKNAHKVTGSSKLIQDIIIPKAKEIGFESEKKQLFKNYRLRPDYYYKLGINKGILIEVERGKTLTNNMDLLDIWKCHICKEANFLFLIVPQIRQTNKGGETVTFNNVVKRLESFFEKDSYINVDAVFLFGY